jgi:hypothetical protein
VCLNTDTEASLTDRNFVLNRLSKVHIQLMTTFLTVRDISANVHEIKKYVNFSIYLSSKNDSIKMIEIHRKMHLVKKLKTNMLIENDILRFEEIIIDVQEKRIIIISCQNMIIEIKIHQKESFVRRNVINQYASIISSRSYVKILYKVKNLLSNRDFLFESSSSIFVFIYAHVINARTTKIIVRNEFSKFKKISSNFKLEIAQKIQYDDCFYASQKHQLTIQTSKKNFIIEELKAELILEEVDDRSRLSSENSKIRIFADEVDEKFEIKIFFEVIAFDDDIERHEFDKLINEFSTI